MGGNKMRGRGYYVKSNLKVEGRVLFIHLENQSRGILRRYECWLAVVLAGVFNLLPNSVFHHKGF